MSPRHPNLEENGSQKTEKCVKAFYEKSKNCTVQNKFKPDDKKKKKYTIKAKWKIRRLSSLDVSEFLAKHNIKDTTELYALAQKRKKGGQQRLS